MIAKGKARRGSVICKAKGDGTNPPPPVWLLTAGIWNDSAPWADSSNWEDS